MAAAVPSGGGYEAKTAGAAGPYEAKDASAVSPLANQDPKIQKMAEEKAARVFDHIHKTFGDEINLAADVIRHGKVLEGLEHFVLPETPKHPGKFSIGFRREMLSRQLIRPSVDSDISKLDKHKNVFKCIELVTSLVAKKVKDDRIMQVCLAKTERSTDIVHHWEQSKIVRSIVWNSFFPQKPTARST